MDHSDVCVQPSAFTPKTSIPFILSAGFVDGLNPCAIATLLFLIAFIFTLKKLRREVFKYGIVYILAIYLVYFLIGLGLIRGLTFFGVHHFFAKVGVILVIFLGLINLKDYFFPKWPISLRIPMPARTKIMEQMYKGTLPATFVLGFLVGLCTFPCSGAIYVAVTGLLAAKETWLRGVAYLLLYNLAFVAPLILVLAASSNRWVTEKLTNWQERNEPKIRLLYGVSMIAIGVIIWIWFI